MSIVLMAAVVAVPVVVAIDEVFSGRYAIFTGDIISTLCGVLGCFKMPGLPF